jgi:transposase
MLNPNLTGGMSMVTRRRTYDPEFKREAIRLVLDEGQKASEVERNLGISNSCVSRWIREMKDDPEYAFPGKGRMKQPEQELHDLKKKLERVTRERDILKKAIAIFSTDPNRYSDS